MLVKLGNVWFSADKIERINPSSPPHNLKIYASGNAVIPLPDAPNAHYVTVRTFNCSDTVVSYFSSNDEAEKAAEEYALITNNALDKNNG